uniref:ATP synthase complex subunit 8 n=1 Tax=Enneaphyllus aeneipennis TaxID=2546605 RepID=A0A6H0N690_9CUCU|nr:ATP synthase F0 subunit 8 [Enneaphyllus aeneipennis]
MPQMAPLNWLILMVFFTGTFLFFKATNYCSFTYTIKNIKNLKVQQKLNWKW